jgi:hypothetical protein
MGRISTFLLDLTEQLQRQVLENPKRRWSQLILYIKALSAKEAF